MKLYPSSSSDFLLLGAIACLLAQYIASAATPNNDSTDCYNSTLSILMAQTQGSKDFILCPNTTIDMGVPANPQFTDFIDGDFPLVILGDGVTVQCGPDGSSTNNCVLNGGFIQLVSIPNNPLFPGKITSNDLKVQGLTFSGTLQGGNNILTTAIAVGTVGTNMIVEDCIFTNLEESDHVVFMSASLSSPEDLLPQQSTLTISNSVFTDITYKREILHVDSQTLIVQGSTFHNIEYQSCGCNESSLFVAADDANMSVEDTSISNVEVLTSVVILYGDTEFTTKGLSVSNTTIYDMDSRPEDEYCEEGLVVEKVQNGALDECLELLEDSSVTKNVEGSAVEESPSVEDSSTVEDESAEDPDDLLSTPVEDSSAFIGTTWAVPTLVGMITLWWL